LARTFPKFIFVQHLLFIQNIKLSSTFNYDMEKSHFKN